jgi:DNA-directed RNA polymerase subunit RPC12/RpoP
VKMKKLGPILFRCSSCGAEYKIVMVEPPIKEGRAISCACCDTPFPATEGALLLEYVLAKRPR